MAALTGGVSLVMWLYDRRRSAALDLALVEQEAANRAVPHRVRFPVASPDAIPMPKGEEMAYHMAGHAAAGAELSQKLASDTIAEFVAEEEARIAERNKSMNEMDLLLEEVATYLKGMDQTSRDRIRLRLDQADADSVQSKMEDEAFYQQVLEEEGLTKKPKKVAKKAGKKTKKRARK
jgi:hypothetical protein